MATIVGLTEIWLLCFGCLTPKTLVLCKVANILHVSLMVPKLWWCGQTAVWNLQVKVWSQGTRHKCCHV